MVFDYARMAVQVFLVIGGDIVAKTLAPRGRFVHTHPWRLIVQRYVRLVPPLAIALVLVRICSAVSQPWLAADFVPSVPSLPQVIDHLTLLKSILGIEPLSIGLWYVAIDFQPFACMALLLWFAKGHARWAVLLLHCLAHFSGAGVEPLGAAQRDPDHAAACPGFGPAAHAGGQRLRAVPDARRRDHPGQCAVGASGVELCQRRSRGDAAGLTGLCGG